MRMPAFPMRRAATIASLVAVTGVLGASAIVAANGGGGAVAEPSFITFDEPLGTVIRPGPTFVPPFTVVTVVPGTLITLPVFTLVTSAPSSTGATMTSAATPTTPASSEPDSTSSATVNDDDGEHGTANLEITAASIDCAGLLHLEYVTEAQPEPAPATSHVIILSPLANPAAIVAQQLIDRPTNGAWVFDVPAPSVESNRVVVVVDFQPDDLEGVLLVDEAEAVLPTNCPDS